MVLQLMILLLLLIPRSTASPTVTSSSSTSTRITTPPVTTPPPHLGLDLIEDRNVYIRHPSEMWMVLVNEMSGNSGNSPEGLKELSLKLLVKKEGEFEMAPLGNVRDVLSGQLGDPNIGLPARVFLFDGSHFIRWWHFATCQALPPWSRNSCRSRTIPISDSVEVPNFKTPKTFVFKVGPGLSRVAGGTVSFFVLSEKGDLKQCNSSDSPSHLAVTMTSPGTLQLQQGHSAPIILTFKAWDVTEIADLEHTATPITLHLLHPTTNILLRFASPTKKVNCWDMVASNRARCVDPLTGRPLGKRRQVHDTVLKVGPPANTTIVVEYVAERAGGKTQVSQRVDTADIHHVRNACYNSSTVGCHQIKTYQGSTNFCVGCSEQIVVVCDVGVTILCERKQGNTILEANPTFLNNEDDKEVWKPSKMLTASICLLGIILLVLVTGGIYRMRAGKLKFHSNVYAELDYTHPDIWGEGEVEIVHSNEDAVDEILH